MALRPLSGATRRMALSKRSASKAPVYPDVGFACRFDSDQGPEFVEGLMA